MNDQINMNNYIEEKRKKELSLTNFIYNFNLTANNFMKGHGEAGDRENITNYYEEINSLYSELLDKKYAPIHPDLTDKISYVEKTMNNILNNYENY